MHKFGADAFFRSCETIKLDLLDVLGIEYIIEHFISDLKNRQEQELYNQYVSMCLYAISNNRKMTKTLSKIKGISAKPKETRSGKQVAEEVAKKIGIKINWGK